MIQHFSEDLPTLALQIGAMYALPAETCLVLTPWDYYTLKRRDFPAAATAKALVSQVLEAINDPYNLRCFCNDM